MPKPEKQKTTGLTREVFWGGLGIIMKYLAPHAREVFVLVGLSLASALAEAFVPYLAGRVFDAIIAVARDAAMILTGVWLIIAIWYVLKVITDLTDWRIGIGEAQLGTTLYGEYIAHGYERLFLMPVSFHKSRKQGEVGERIQRAANWLNNIVENVLIHLTPRFLSVIVSLVITFFINRTLASILLVAIAGYALMLVFSVGELAYLQRRMHRAYSKAFGYAYDSMENIQEIKQATAEGFESRRIYRHFVTIAGRLWLDQNKVFRRLTLAQSTIVSLTQLVLFVISVVLVRQHTITPGQLVMFNGYAAMLFGPFVILGQNWNTIQNGLVALVRSEKVLGLPTEIYTPADAVSLAEIRGAVEFRHVSFSHKKARAAVLNDISFSVAPGETVALVGESGVGKTTLVELIMAFHFPAEGRVLIDGHDVQTLDLKQYRRNIAVVPQEVSLFNDTIGMNIRYGSFEASDNEVRRAAREAHADEFIESFPEKYKQVVGWRGIKLSTGQKQRIAIARAILRNPRILILDEPTSALDAKTEEKIKESLEHLMKGRTTFIIAHRLSTVREADKILVLRGGKISDIGTHAELIGRGGVYKELYDLQFRGKVT